MKLWNSSTAEATAFDERVGRGAHVKPGDSHDFDEQTARELLAHRPDVWTTKAPAPARKKKES